MTITPIDEIPEFTVQAKRIPQMKTNRIADLNRLNVKDPEWSGAYKATVEIAKASIVGWSGSEEVFPKALPFSTDNVEVLVASRLVIKEATEKEPAVYESIWSRIQNRLEEASAIELKN